VATDTLEVIVNSKCCVALETMSSCGDVPVIRRVDIRDRSGMVPVTRGSARSAGRAEFAFDALLTTRAR